MYVRLRSPLANFHRVLGETLGHKEAIMAYLLEPHPDTIWAEIFAATPGPAFRLNGDRVYLRLLDREHGGAVTGLIARIRQTNDECERQHKENATREVWDA